MESVVNRISRMRTGVIAIILIVVAVAVPAVTMVGCNMEMSAPISFTETLCGHIEGFGQFISEACGGTYLIIDGLGDSIASSGQFLFNLMAALAVAVAMLFVMPTVREHSAVLVPVAPPPPPEDPLGQRLSI